MSNKIQFWSIVPGIEDIAPIVPAKDFIPEWWKGVPAHFSSPDQIFPDQDFMNSLGQDAKISTTINVSTREQDILQRNTGTIKLCPAIHDWFSTGWILPMWTDVFIEIFEDGKLGVSGGKAYNFETPSPPDYEKLFNGGLMDNITYIHWLPEEQRKRGAVGFVQIQCPWRMRTPPGISCYQFPMYWHFNPDFEVPPGPIWTDEYAQVNPQIIIKRYGKITIKRGTPLCVFVPYDRSTVDNLELEIVKTDVNGTPIDEECQKIEVKTSLMVQTVFRGGYRKMQKKKTAEGCPFPHGK